MFSSNGRPFIAPSNSEFNHSWCLTIAISRFFEGADKYNDDATMDKDKVQKTVRKWLVKMIINHFSNEFEESNTKASKTN